MGNSNSINNEEYNNFNKKFKQIKNEKENNYKKFNFYIDINDNKTVITYQIRVFDYNEIEKYEKQIDFIKNNEINFVEILDYFSIINRTMCKDNKDIFIVNKYYANNLLTEFGNYIPILKNEIEKLEPDLWLIIKKISQIINISNLNNIFLHKIVPEFICFNENGDVKLYHEINIENKNLQFLIDNFNINEFLPLSPEILNEIRFVKDNNRSREFKLNYDKCSIFSLGISLVSILSKNKLKNYYNFNDYKVKSHLINADLKNLSLNYFSEDFISILNKMIEVNPIKRISSNELLEFIYDNEVKS